MPNLNPQIILIRVIINLQTLRERPLIKVKPCHLNGCRVGSCGSRYTTLEDYGLVNLLS